MEKNNKKTHCGIPTCLLYNRSERPSNNSVKPLKFIPTHLHVTYFTVMWYWVILPQVHVWKQNKVNSAQPLKFIYSLNFLSCGRVKLPQVHKLYERYIINLFTQMYSVINGIIYMHLNEQLFND